MGRWVGKEKVGLEPALARERKREVGQSHSIAREASFETYGRNPRPLERYARPLSTL